MTFRKLSAPTRYTNANGVSFGFVVRVEGLNRKHYLNDIDGTQDYIIVQTPGPGQTFYITTALFKSVNAAYQAAERYYNSHGEVYEFELCDDGDWYFRATDSKIQYMPAAVIAIESQIMEFE